MALSKDEMRAEYLKKRQEMSHQVALDLSQAIQNRILKNPVWKNAKSLALYSSIRNEVDTKLLFLKALEEGKEVYFPRVEEGICFYQVNDPADLQKGAWGIMEPKDSCFLLKEITGLDLVVVPGVIFDKKGYRLGYGRGFYDRFLGEHSISSLALAYSLQVVDDLPHQEWDKKVSMLGTENGIYVFS